MRKTHFLVVFLFLVFMTVEKVEALTFNHQIGWLESAYVTWLPVNDAKSYNVYYSGEGINERKIDTQLIRQYDGYFRADILGLKAGNYTITVKAVNDNKIEVETATSSTLSVKPHTREGFAFSNKIVPGGYNEDGTVKDNARIIYISAGNVNTVTCKVSDDKGTASTFTGLSEILAAYGRGYDKTPLIIRMIGLIKGSQITGLKDGNFVSFTGSNSSARMIENITFEGVGDDATAYGYGFCMKRSKSIEVRNVGIMLFGDDAVSMDTDNANIWIHNNDFFYGAPGSDADQVKGDGTIDMKYNSSNITISFNHFWDSGKSMGCGGSTETVPTYFVTFHHNWFDHSDSRNPRLHYATAHVYNNYFDGVAKYCIGNTTETSAFIEANYFRNSGRPMMISGQGTDAYNSATGSYNAKGTFSGQDGGMTKAYNNHIEGATKLVYQTQNPIQFDAYLVSSRNEQIPETIKSVRGSFAYTNFDTAADMYVYFPDSPENAKDIVTTYAGRIGGGDFKWIFHNAIDDASSDVNMPLKSAITEYKTALLSIQGIEKEEPGENPDPEIEDGTGGGICELLTNGVTSGFIITGGTSNSKGSVVVNNTNYNCCLKMGSNAGITFTIKKTMKLTLLFNESEGKTINIDNGIGKLTITNGKIEVDNIAPGTYTIVKASGESYLFYISLSEKEETGVDMIVENESVYFNNNIIHNPTNKEINVYNTFGQLILSDNKNLDFSSYVCGVYLIHIRDSNRVLKIIR